MQFEKTPDIITTRTVWKMSGSSYGVTLPKKEVEKYKGKKVKIAVWFE
jgi:hypothetical protein